jgi:hypothetical protein
MYGVRPICQPSSAVAGGFVGGVVLAVCVDCCPALASAKNNINSSNTAGIERQGRVAIIPLFQRAEEPISDFKLVTTGNARLYEDTSLANGHFGQS